MQIQNLIALLYDSAAAIDIGFGTGTKYHLNQKIIQRDDLVKTLPFVYLFRPLIKNDVRNIPSAGYVSSYTLPLVYFYKVDKHDNSEIYEEAQEAGDDFIKEFVNEIDKNDFISIDEIEGEGDVKFFDTYIVRKFSLTVIAPDDFDYCSLDAEGLNYALNFGLN